MNLGVDEAHPLDHAVALHRAGGRQNLSGGIAIADVLEDRAVLRQHVTVVEAEGGHIALRIHGREIATVLGFLRLDVSLDQIEGEAGLAQRDMRRERAGSGGVIKLHGRAPGRLR